ncbi:MAG: hypothetical protein ACK4U0_14840 [Mesorhizobium sp.]
MYNDQTTEFNKIESLPSNMTAFFRRFLSIARNQILSYRQKKALSKLSLHLKYDVGLLDVRPTGEMLIGDTMKNRQTTLEDLWLRHR